ncbi:50S ribosomal protein L33 [Alkalihalobacillus trypoxylicola]|uniref:Large ribosomal subunit protein bL33 n=1 Tax=Alkalihalobacillus trypoxylicola TaxID=519424 RepID=A0A162EXM2_9BACI|nr:50S ribosomal protein L33 [Alkalihalobacillus trypoxylicola]
MGGTAVAHKVVLACTICQSRNYTSEKNKEAQVKRIEIKKFCKYCNRHTLHRETK